MKNKSMLNAPFEQTIILFFIEEEAVQDEPRYFQRDPRMYRDSVAALNEKPCLGLMSCIAGKIIARHKGKARSRAAKYEPVSFTTEIDAMHSAPDGGQATKSLRQKRRTHGKILGNESAGFSDEKTSTGSFNPTALIENLAGAICGFRTWSNQVLKKVTATSHTKKGLTEALSQLG